MLPQGGLMYQPLYYWVDIFAVFQNFQGDFKVRGGGEEGKREEGKRQSEAVLQNPSPNP